MLWFFVIRTAYQGKLFEFTVTSIRKPDMKTIIDLRKNNFTFFYSNDIKQYTAHIGINEALK